MASAALALVDGTPSYQTGMYHSKKNMGKNQVTRVSSGMAEGKALETTARAMCKPAEAVKYLGGNGYDRVYTFAKPRELGKCLKKFAEDYPEIVGITAKHFGGTTKSKGEIYDEVTGAFTDRAGSYLVGSGFKEEDYSLAYVIQTQVTGILSCGTPQEPGKTTAEAPPAPEKKTFREHLRGIAETMSGAAWVPPH